MIEMGIKAMRNKTSKVESNRKVETGRRLMINQREYAKYDNAVGICIAQFTWPMPSPSCFYLNVHEKNASANAAVLHPSGRPLTDNHSSECFNSPEEIATTACSLIIAQQAALFLYKLFPNQKQ